MVCKRIFRRVLDFEIWVAFVSRLPSASAAGFSRLFGIFLRSAPCYKEGIEEFRFIHAFSALYLYHSRIITVNKYDIYTSVR